LDDQIKLAEDLRGIQSIQRQTLSAKVSADEAKKVGGGGSLRERALRKMEVLGNDQPYSSQQSTGASHQDLRDPYAQASIQSNAPLPPRKHLRSLRERSMGYNSKSQNIQESRAQVLGPAQQAMTIQEQIEQRQHQIQQRQKKAPLASAD